MEPEKIKELEEKCRLYEAVLNNIGSGTLITDPEGYVIFFSEAYGRFLGKKPEGQIGKFTTEVVENSRMHIVAKTGIAEINHPHKIIGREMVVQRIPIFIDGKLAAVFGQVMFENVTDVQALADKLHLLEGKIRFYEKELEDLRYSKYSLKNIIGSSSPMLNLKKMALKSAMISAPVLITGESGTGKELLAHAIHAASDRKSHPLIRINCAAIPKDLLEAELFGYEPGAFTGAGAKSKPGKFELAHRGSIFLDEISELPLDMQPKLLRVLEEKEFERLGGNKVIKSDFRLIAATHDNLEQHVEKGKFRRDLFYRLNVIPLDIPPLRERRDDIAPIAMHLVQSLGKVFGGVVKNISPEVAAIFEKYSWPGNVRELSNILERVLYSMDGLDDTIKVDHLPLFLRNMAIVQENKARILRDVREESEREALINVLRISGNNKNKAARILGIHRTALYKKMRKFNIS